MSTQPETRVFPPHAFVAIKDSHLDQDRIIPLTEDVASAFALGMNRRFATDETKALLADERAPNFADIINKESLFPFIARVENGDLILSPALHKTDVPSVLKDLSDGTTEICKTLTADSNLSESAKFALAMLFQAPIYNAYHAAGMTEGAHTKYVTRSC